MLLLLAELTGPEVVMVGAAVGTPLTSAIFILWKKILDQQERMLLQLEKNVPLAEDLVIVSEAFLKQSKDFADRMPSKAEMSKLRLASERLIQMSRGK